MTAKIQLLTVREVCEVLRTEERAVRRLLRSGEIPGEVRIGRKVFVNAERLEEHCAGKEAS